MDSTALSVSVTRSEAEGVVRGVGERAKGGACSFSWCRLLKGWRR